MGAATLGDLASFVVASSVYLPPIYMSLRSHCNELRKLERHWEEKRDICISVPEIICCGKWPLNKKQFRYNIILIFYSLVYIYINIYIYIYIYILYFTARYHHDALARFRGVIIIVPLEKGYSYDSLLTFIYIYMA